MIKKDMKLLKGKQSKRKRELQAASTVTTSVSQILIVQPSKKYQHPTTVDDMMPPKDINKSKLNDKPNYLQINDQTFKKMLLTSLEGAENYRYNYSTQQKDYNTHVIMLSWLITCSISD